jgi:drug/metabolite transporter (DMT)-like permease
VTVILSVIFNREQLSTLADVAIALTIGGVVLASASSSHPDPVPSAGEGNTSGVPFALLAMLCWGVASYLLGRAGQQTGWFFPVFGARLVQFIGTLGVASVLAIRGAFGPIPGGRSVVIACASAVCDSVGNAAFVRGSQVGLVSITSAVSASFPLIVIAGSLLLFKERPSVRQWVGILSAILGLILLGLAQ